MSRPMYIQPALGSDHEGDDNLYLQVLDENFDTTRIATKREYKAFCRAKNIVSFRQACVTDNRHYR